MSNIEHQVAGDSLLGTFIKILRERMAGEAFINTFLNDEAIRDSSHLTDEHQRAAISFFFSRYIYLSPEPFPIDVKIHLLAVNDVNTWLNNVSKYFLPYFIDREHLFF